MARSQCDCVVVLAPAKLNLHLEVGRRRADGYHEIRSVIQMISLCDTLKIGFDGPETACSVVGDFGVCTADNLITQAVEGFRSVTGIKHGIRIEVDKKVPSRAGLGGGSSDAAATLRGLELLCGSRLARRVRKRLALRLGSDVPFFLETAVALVQGRGERVRSIRARTDFDALLVYPGFAVPTVEAFGWLDERCTEWRLSTRELESRYCDGTPSEWRFVNSFNKVVGIRYSVVPRVVQALRTAGAACAGLTGSGSTVFGVFPVDGSAHEARTRLARDFGVALVRPLARKPRIRIE